MSDADDLRSLSLTLLYDDGKATDKQQKLKKKRGKKKKREMEEDTDACSISGTIEDSHTLVVNSLNVLEETNQIIPSKLEKKGKTQKHAVASSNTMNSMTLIKDVRGNSVSEDRLDGKVTDGSSVGKVTKKRKRLSSGEDGTPELPSKKSKLSVPNMLMVETKDENTNSNARSRSSSPPKSDSKALKAGKSTKKARTVSVSPSPKTKAKKKKEEECDEEPYETSSLSIFTTPVKKGKSSAKSPETNEPKSSVVDEIVGDLYSVITGSCSMVKKAIGLVSSNTDPGPSNTNYKVKVSFLFWSTWIPLAHSCLVSGLLSHSQVYQIIFVPFHLSVAFHPRCIYDPGQ